MNKRKVQKMLANRRAELSNDLGSYTKTISMLESMLNSLDSAPLSEDEHKLQERLIKRGIHRARKSIKYITRELEELECDTE